MVRDVILSEVIIYRKIRGSISPKPGTRARCKMISLSFYRKIVSLPPHLISRLFILMLSSDYSKVSQNTSYFQISRPNVCMHVLIPHACRPISSLLI